MEMDHGWWMREGWIPSFGSASNAAQCVLSSSGGRYEWVLCLPGPFYCSPFSVFLHCLPQLRVRGRGREQVSNLPVPCLAPFQKRGRLQGPWLESRLVWRVVADPLSAHDRRLV